MICKIKNIQILVEEKKARGDKMKIKINLYTRYSTLVLISLHPP